MFIGRSRNRYGRIFTKIVVVYLVGSVVAINGFTYHPLCIHHVRWCKILESFTRIV